MIRRKDREIADIAGCLDVLRRCRVVRIGIVSEGEPYIVPVSFGVEEMQGRIALYFHSAQAGRKVDALRHDARVCIEADIFYKNESTPYGITARYESIIAFGSVQQVDGQEKLHGLRCLLAHYGYTDYEPESCRFLQHTLVYKVILDSITGKRNLPQDHSEILPDN